jgi:MFS family permease
LTLLAGVGVGNALVDLGLFTLIARLAPDDVLARVFGLLESLGALTVGLGAIVASLLIELSGVRSALVMVGLLGPILVAAASPRLVRLDRFIGVRDQEIALLHGVPMFRPLPLPVIEQLARGLEPVTAPAGQVVFNQGDAGDYFYVIESGEAEVIGDGRRVATLQPGQAFGEIALLRQVPRTATVRAATELRLQALTSDHFLPIVTGFTPSAFAAGASVDALLDRYTPADRPDPPADPGHPAR